MRRLVVLALTTLAVAVLAPPAGAGTETAPARPARLVVALGLGEPSLQAGVVRGREVILARGFEVEVARALAQRLGTPVGRFVYAPAASRRLASGAATWQLALAGIERRPAANAASGLSAPYLTSDVAVVTRRGLTRPRGVADLRARVVCARRGSTGVRAIASLRPRTSRLLVAGTERLRELLRTGACDVALVPAFEVGRFVAGHRALLGPAVGRLRQGEGLAVHVRAGAGLEVAAVNRALANLRRDGTLGRLARTWLGLDPAALPRLR